MNLVLLDRYQPLAPRVRVVVIIMVVNIMLPASGIAALSSARKPELAKQFFFMGSQKCMDAPDGSTPESAKGTRNAGGVINGIQFGCHGHATSGHRLSFRIPLRAVSGRLLVPGT